MKVYMTLLSLSFICAMLGIRTGAIAFWIGAFFFSGLLLLLVRNDARDYKRDHQVPAMARKVKQTDTNERLPGQGG